MSGSVTAVVVAGSVASYVVTYVVTRVATRPARVRPGKPTMDLGDEPPAVVNLLANRWRLTDDAAEATLLDLAARGWLELRQADDRPYHTTVHLRPVPGDAPPLLPFEQRVLDRVRAVAVDGVAPAAALVFRDRRQASSWNRDLRREVVAYARARGLSRPRPGRLGETVLAVVVLASELGILLGLLPHHPALAVAGGIAWFVVMSLVGLSMGERDTPAGRRAAAHWLSVREWLRGHEEFACLPPASVAVWDRYLAYGAALGVTPATNAVLGLGLGDHRRVWTAYGGRWRRVRVRYPRFWPRYGQSAPLLAVRGGSVTALGVAFVLVASEVRPPAPTRDPVATLVADLLPWVGFLLVALGGYLCVRTVVDLRRTRTVVGEVLWRQRWRRRTRKYLVRTTAFRPEAYLDHLAVYDGTGDRTVAWVAPYDLTREVEAGDIVEIVVRPWSRRIVSLTIIGETRTRHVPFDPSTSGQPPGS